MDYKEAKQRLNEAGRSYYHRTGVGLSQRLEWTGNLVKIVHEDGTVMCFQDAALIDISKMWLGVLTEHYGYYVFDKEDLLLYEQYSRIYDEITPLEDLL